MIAPVVPDWLIGSRSAADATVVVAEGSDADLVIYKPHGTRTLDDQTVRSAARYSPFAGMPVRGRVAATILRGRIAFDGTDVIVPEGTGRFVPRQPFDLARV